MCEAITFNDLPDGLGEEMHVSLFEGRGVSLVVRSDEYNIGRIVFWRDVETDRVRGAFIDIDMLELKHFSPSASKASA